ncbi:MAG TPA: hypothetical protein DCR55_17540 [Lentisphaeria bacterium]|nr:hypothetical protein [Lentisphaeria bacterium]
MPMYSRDYVRGLLEVVNESAVDLWEDDYQQERREAEAELRAREHAAEAAAQALLLSMREADALMAPVVDEPEENRDAKEVGGGELKEETCVAEYGA